MTKLVECLSYEDVLLEPQYSTIISREEISISSSLGSKTFAFPVISSPMDTVTETAMANAMSTFGGLGIIHRYCSIEEQVTMLLAISSEHPRAAAIGVTGDYHERALSLVAAGAEILCVDVAHGHHILMKNALLQLRKTFQKTVHLMAGNVATLSGVNDLADWGADSVRCNIGGGSICSTRIQTGHGLPGLHTLFECSKTEKDVSIIADGGIKSPGDIVKALAAGADFVMVGSLLSGTIETPGDVLHEPTGETFKVYRGMASKDAQVSWRGKSSSNEGVSTTVPFRGPVRNILEDIKNGIRSGLSYSGARHLSEFQAKAKFVRQTNAGSVESSAHILLKK
ncbi:MAG TPA: guanosine monophosphate reductase [Flavobacteriales bacterium]|nr:guanosine monophosphate reductase [Flavobacteriales bacterium]